MIIDYAKYEGHTKGPWKWLCNPKSSILLKSHKWVVMSFERWGMGGATPCFRTAIHCLEKAKAFFKIIPGEEHHASWNQQLVHPDAALIADAPELLAHCKQADERIKEMEVKLETIAKFGRANPGRGFTCAMMALAALKAEGGKLR